MRGRLFEPRIKRSRPFHEEARMGTYLYVVADTNIREWLANVKPGTDAAIAAAEVALTVALDLAKSTPADDVAALADYNAAVAKFDPHGTYGFYATRGQGLGRLMAYAYVEACGLSPHYGETGDPVVIRTILERQRYRVRNQCRIGGTAAEWAAEDALFLDVITRLITSIDGGIPFRLCWG
jgi:hypothetical protein